MSVRRTRRLRLEPVGRGYATEIGQAGLAFAAEDLGPGEVVAFTERHNRRSRAVMERLGMGFVDELAARDWPRAASASTTTPRSRSTPAFPAAERPAQPPGGPARPAARSSRHSSTARSRA